MAIITLNNTITKQGIWKREFADTVTGELHEQEIQDYGAIAKQCEQLRERGASQALADRLIPGEGRHVARIPMSLIHQKMKREGICMNEAVEAIMLDDNYSMFRTNSKTNRVYLGEH